jgi:hypothetical protein
MALVAVVEWSQGHLEVEGEPCMGTVVRHLFPSHSPRCLESGV